MNAIFSSICFNKQRLLCLLAAITSGIFISLLFDPINEFGALWMALVPLLLIIRTTTPRISFWTGWLTGIITWTIQLHWLTQLTETGGVPIVVYLGYAFLVLYLGFYVGLFALLAARLRIVLLGQNATTPSWRRILICILLEPMLWVALEAIRSHLFTGFAWNPLGLAFTMNLPVFQLSAVGGVGLVSALIVALNGAITSLLERIWWSIRRQMPEQFFARLMLSLETSLPFLLFLIVFLWGSHRIKAYDTCLKKDATPIHILAQDSNHPIAPNQPKSEYNFFTSADDAAKYINLLFPEKRFHLWLTPESSFLHEDLSLIASPSNEITKIARKKLQTISRETAPLLLGGTYSRKDQDTTSFYNASLLITETDFDESKHLYRKRHLVPFGEYIPFDKTFTSLQQLVPTGMSCSAGDEKTITLPSGHRFGPLICFDDCDAALARDSVNAGAQFLVNTSNDVWFMPSIEPVAHLRQAIARAVETGVPMIRTSNTGGVSYIDAVGRICYINGQTGKLKNYTASPHKIELLYESQSDKIAIYTCTLPLTKNPFSSSYLMGGEMIFTLPCLLFMFGFIFWLIFKRYQCKMKTIASLVLFFSALLPLSAQAEVNTNDLVRLQLLPTAAMAIDDGNLSLAQETANRILLELGLTPERRAQAEEILIRADLKRNAYDDVIKRVNNCPELAVERRTVFHMLAYLGKEEYDKALKCYDDANLPPTKEWGLAALRLALIADLKQDNKLRAAERFSLVNTNATSNPKIRAANALAWNHTFPSPMAREALLQMAMLAEQGELFYECARQLPNAFKNVSDSRPFESLKKVLSSPTIDPIIKARLSIITAQLATNANEKIAFAKAAVETAPTDEDKRQAYLALGEAYIVEGSQKELGIDYLKKGITMDASAKDAPYTQLRIAETYMEIGDINLALKEYDRYRQSYILPDLTIRYLHGYARALVRNNNTLDAIEVFKKAIANVKNDVSKKIELLSEAAQVATDAKYYDYAIDFLQQRLEIDVQNRPTITLSLAQLHEQKEDFKKAASLYASVCNMTPIDNKILIVATLRLGAIYVNSDRATDAIARYSTSISRLPKDASEKEQIILARGKTYYSIANYDRAYEDFNQIKDTPVADISNEARFFLVLCLYRLGRDIEAHQLADTYINAATNNHRVPDILLWLAKSDFNNGNYAKASERFSMFIERWKNDARIPQILYHQALANYFDQRYHETLQSIARIVKEYPDADILPDARFLQAQTLIQHARHSEARDILRNLISQYPQATWIGDAYGLFGDCLSITATDDVSRLKMSLDAYRHAITHLSTIDAGKALNYRYKIGRVYEKQNQRPNAAKEYYQLIYTILNQPEKYTNGIVWGKRALLRLNDIETAAGHNDKLNELHQRILRANIPGLTL